MPATATNHTNGSSNGSALRDKVQFPTNTPVLLTLDTDPQRAQAKPGVRGDQYMYFFEGSQIAFVDPPVHALIVNSGAQRGDEIAITKRETRNGNRKGIAWDVELVQDEPNPHPGAPEWAEPAPAPAPAPKPASQAKSASAPAPAPASAPPSVLTMGGALIAAIDAIAEASRHASAKHGWDEELPMDTDLIQKLAVTIYIQAHGGKRAA